MGYLAFAISVRVKLLFAVKLLGIVNECEWSKRDMVSFFDEQ